MAVTLAEAKKNVQDALAMGVIDEFRKSNWLWENMQFDDAVSPVGGGATLTYGYTRLKTQPTAAFRAINAEYSAQEVSKERITTDLAIFGGAFQVDRVIAEMGGIVNEVTLQMEQKIKAASALFNDSVINGDSSHSDNSFDGLEKILTGSSTEFNKATTIDLSTTDKVTANYVAFLDNLDEFLMELDGRPSALLGNSKLISRIRACARRSSAYTETKDDFGRQVFMYDGIPLIDLGTKCGSNDPVVKIDGSSKETSLYAVRLGLDGFHGVTVKGQNMIRSFMPDFSTAGAVKKGEVEMIATVALKATKAAGVMRKIKVTA